MDTPVSILFVIKKLIGEKNHCLIGSWSSIELVLKEVFLGRRGVQVVPEWEVSYRILFSWSDLGTERD